MQNPLANVAMKNMITIVALAVGFGLGFSAGRLSGRAPNEEKMTYAIHDGQAIKGSDVLSRIRGDLEQLELNAYDLKKKAVLEFIKEKKPTPASPELDLSKVDLNKEELHKFLSERGIKEGSLSKKQLEDAIGNFKIQKMMETRKKEESTEIAALDIQWKIPLPTGHQQKIANGAAPRWGRFFAPVKIVAVGNYHCPFCSQANERLKELRDKYKEQIQIHYRFSMRDPESSVVFAAAEAALCAADQNKFWEFHDLVSSKAPLETGGLSANAEALKLDMDDFHSCLKKRSQKSALEREILASQEAKLDEVPLISINGRVVKGTLNLERLSEIVDASL